MSILSKEMCSFFHENKYDIGFGVESIKKTPNGRFFLYSNGYSSVSQILCN